MFNRKSSALFLFLALTCVASTTLAAWTSAAGDCRGINAWKKDGENEQGQKVVRWDLECAGTCPAGADGTVPKCAVTTAQDHIGNYFFCGCDGTLATECCQTISRYQPDGGDKPGFKGDCPSCPASGACKVVLSVEGDEAQASCIQPPPPPDGE